MGWTERIREAAYTSPSGIRITFDYEDVSRSVEKKTSAFTFPDADGTYVQDLGRTDRRYPLRIFFWGDNHDLASNAFEEILLERGAGTLEHPMYGSVNVVPFGEISQRDDLKTAANQSVIEVVFWETIGLAYPTTQGDPASEVLSAVDEYNAAKAEEFANSVNTDTESLREKLKGVYTASLNAVKSGLQKVADVQENVQKQFDAIYDSINTGLDILVGQPTTLAFQTTLLIQTPARASANIKAKLDAYGNLIGAIISGDGANVSGSSQSNDFYSNDLYASTHITGLITSVINTEFQTKPEALSAAEFILDEFADITAWREANYAIIGAIDTGESYQQLQEAVGLAAGFLVEISFTLKQERSLVLTRNRTIIDLCAELYGAVDSVLDFFISSNDLSGDEILELPAGRKIVYYI